MQSLRLRKQVNKSAADAQATDQKLRDAKISSADTSVVKTILSGSEKNPMSESQQSRSVVLTAAPNMSPPLNGSLVLTFPNSEQITQANSSQFQNISNSMYNSPFGLIGENKYYGSPF